ncbi:similar to An13g01200 [Aspergillus niger]|uniref:Similar to An13g01200 n=1 Tax=Aspergillus niger TaxID=5061 RepID=A0A100ITK5_ASPNG|nr:similar to An13g01200 [Aspergillus niger]
MTHLWIPGLPYKKAPVADRFKSSAPFLSFPTAHTARFVFRRNYEITSSRSFQTVSPPRTVVRSLLPVSTGVRSLPRKSASPDVRSFAQLRQGSQLPVSVRPSTPSPASPPVPAATGAGRSLTGSVLSSRLEERRASRQARSRPWAATPKVEGHKKSPEGHRSTTRPSPRVERASGPSDRAIRSPHMAARTRRALRRIDEVLAKPALVKAGAGGRKAKSVKSVRFGEDTVIPVSCWIVRREHVFPAPLAAMGHLQGWKVTPRAEPDEEGEMEKYTTYWGSDSYVMLDIHSVSEPCGRDGCQYQRLASIAARRPGWGPATVFLAWNMLREKVRQRGGFRLRPFILAFPLSASVLDWLWSVLGETDHPGYADRVADAGVYPAVVLVAHYAPKRGFWSEGSLTTRGNDAHLSRRTRRTRRDEAERRPTDQRQRHRQDNDTDNDSDSDSDDDDTDPPEADWGWWWAIDNTTISTPPSTDDNDDRRRRDDNRWSYTGRLITLHRKRNKIREIVDQEDSWTEPKGSEVGWYC